MTWPPTTEYASHELRPSLMFNVITSAFKPNVALRRVSFCLIDLRPFETATYERGGSGMREISVTCALARMRATLSLSKIVDARGSKNSLHSPSSRIWPS